MINEILPNITFTLIEVKSTYTINDKKLKDKIKGSLQNNYNIDIYLYDKGVISVINGKTLL